MMQVPIDRRSLFKGAGALVISIGVPGGLATAAAGGAVRPPLAPDQLDSWLAIKADGDVVAYFGKMDMGQGVDVAIAQIVAEELDVPFERVNVVMGDTAWTVNQGGASGSTGIQKGGIPLRNAAAEARRVLVELASQRLGVPADRLEVTDGVVAVTGDPARKLSYGELIGGRYFDLPMTWNGKIGNDLVAEGQAKPKPPSAYKIVGQSPPRFDVAAKVFGKLDYVTDIKVPGMLHGRMIRPPVAGALPVAVDDGSVRDLPGVRVIRDKGFIGVVAEREWDAVQAAERLHVTWSEAMPPFPEMAALYDHIRQAPVVKREVPVATGEIDPAFASAARIVEAEYVWPFQSARQYGPGLRRRGRAGRRSDPVDRLAEAALRARRSRSRAGPAAGQGPRDLGPGPRLLRAQRRRRCRDRCGIAVEGGGSTGARSGDALRGAWLGSQGPGLDPSCPRGTRRGRRCDRLCFREQGLLAH
jgi:nicotinate dehydrogenase subunit B